MLNCKTGVWGGGGGVERKVSQTEWKSAHSRLLTPGLANHSQPKLYSTFTPLVTGSLFKWIYTRLNRKTNLLLKNKKNDTVSGWWGRYCKTSAPHTCTSLPSGGWVYMWWLTLKDVIDQHTASRQTNTSPWLTSTQERPLHFGESRRRKSNTNLTCQLRACFLLCLNSTSCSCRWRNATSSILWTQDRRCMQHTPQPPIADFSGQGRRTTADWDSLQLPCWCCQKQHQLGWRGRDHYSPPCHGVC